MEMPTPITPEKKKISPFAWLMWWKINPEELLKQLEGYHTLSIWQSSRKVSFLLVLLSITITILFILFLNGDVFTLLDAGILLFLGIFIYRGHKWAMIVGMIVWTIEKLVALVDSPGTFYIQILWWAMYMHSFYLSYQVEKGKKDYVPVVTSIPPPQMPPTPLQPLDLQGNGMGTIPPQTPNFH